VTIEKFEMSAKSTSEYCLLALITQRFARRLVDEMYVGA
jgi:hypothetical protein